MKLSKLVPSAIVLMLGGVISTSASALAVLDAWQLDTPMITNQVNIGHLNLSGGGANIQQEVDGFGNVFVGARFAEAGFVYSTQYIKNNKVGLGDNGLPTNFLSPLEITFTNVTGFVSEVIPSGGFKYVFASGDFFIKGNPDGTSPNPIFADLYATGSIVGIGGTGGTTNVIGGASGSSTILTLLTSQDDAGFVVSNSAGVDLMADFLAGEYFFQAVTTNTVASSGPAGACSFDALAVCADFAVISDGALDVLKVPEPGSMALVGAALLAVGVSRRRVTKN